MSEGKRKSTAIKRETLCLIMGLVLAAFGTICVLITMFAPWRNNNVQSCQIPHVIYYGLWFYCVWNYQGLHCRPNLDVHWSQASVQASRVLMCVSLACALSAWAPLILGLRRFRQRRQRHVPLITAGSMLVTAAITTLIPVTLIAVHLNQDQQFPYIKEIPSVGLGLCTGWVGSGLLVAAGAILLCSNMSCMSGGNKSTEEASPCIIYNSLEETGSALACQHSSVLLGSTSTYHKQFPSENSV
ncbi:hypothetical protein AALO_G00022080 [Alosa alosa]|uniref:Claudin n=1 Tax=Alosa alosa TaxID=278164 RepID=A0AAV6HDQ5_9TELE|nr:hypothetical protein AALO_G00022080 [Alosa alosa]